MVVLYQPLANFTFICGVVCGEPVASVLMVSNTGTYSPFLSATDICEFLLTAARAIFRAVVAVSMELCQRQSRLWDKRPTQHRCRIVNHTVMAWQ